MIKFLIKSAFWLTVLIIVIPVENGPSIDPRAAFDAAKRTADDASGFCKRNPDVCGLADAFAKKAEAVARKAYAFVRERIGREEPASSRPISLFDDATIRTARDSCPTPPTRRT